jgi:hypothetical protein
MTQSAPSGPEDPTPTTADTTPSDVDVEGALKALAELVEAGAVTPEEYAVKKAEWLGKYGS